MEVLFKKRFLKDLNKISSPHVEGVKKIVFEDIPDATSLADIPNVVHISDLRIFTELEEVTTELGSRSKNRRYRNRQQENQSVFTTPLRCASLSDHLQRWRRLRHSERE